MKEQALGAGRRALQVETNVMNIDFNPAEIDFLRQVLNERLGALHQEIQHTDSRSFREDLKKKENLAQQLLSKLPS